MAHLFKAVQIVDNESPFNNQKVDILIKDGHIQRVGLHIDEAAEGAKDLIVVSEEGLFCSIGWFDLNSFVGEPGYEHRETIESLVTAAARGGFTEVACLPNVHPIVQTRTSIEYLKRKSEASPVKLHPIAALTHDLTGEDLAELLDLRSAGALAFSDGLSSLQSANTVLKGLEYLKLFNGVLINRCENAKMAQLGQMHEGVASTRLGLKGIPSVVEEMQVTRDLQIVAYTEGKLHFSQVSTAGALDAIRKAKMCGLQVTCDVAAHQVAFTDETIEPFDTNYKVSPPFRSETDKDAILKAIEDGTIDTIVSAHTPWDIEAKELEFDLAEPGIIGLQTAFSVANTFMAPTVSWRKVVELLSYGSRKIVSLPLPVLAEGAQANLTFFHPEKKWIFTPEVNVSLAKNSPFFYKELKGVVYGTYYNNQFSFNPAYQG